MTKVLSGRTLYGWILASLCGPLAYVAGKGSVAETFVAVGVCTLLTTMAIKAKYFDFAQVRWLAVAECAFLGIVASFVIRMAVNSWPDSGKNNFVPVALLALSLIGAGKGRKAAAEVGTMLMWILLLLFAAVIAGGIGNVKMERLELWSGPSAGYAYLLALMPGIIYFIPREEGSSRSLWLLPVFSALMGVLVIGTLSGPVAKSQDNPLYEYGKSLSLFGVVERYESFVSVALTLSYYSLLSLIMSAANYLGSRVLGADNVMLVVAGTAVLFMQMKLEEAYPVAVGALVMWYTLPVILHKTSGRKWSKTDEEKG